MQFEHFANTYNENAFIQKDLIQWGLDDGLHTIPLTNSTIIEFGAGTGLLTQHLVQQNPSHLLATDLSPNMIEEGKRRVPQANWQLMDAWSSSPKKFNHIFSSSLLQWSPNPQQTLSNWAHHLPKNGTIHALLFIDETLKELHQLLPLNSIIQWKNLATWESFFKNAGLNILKSRQSPQSYNFPNTLHLLKTLKYTGTSIKNHLCGGSLRKILKEYDKQYPSLNNKGISSTWHFCQIIAQKV